MQAKIKLLTLLFFLLYALYPSQVYAASMDWGNCVSGEGVATLKCIPVIFNNIVNWALILSGVTALFFVIISGTRYIRSGGDQEKIKGARETLTYAIVGLVIILLSFGIINFISYVTNVDCIKEFGFSNCT